MAINVVDVAGELALTQKAIEAYKTKNPKLVSRITFTKAPAPELPGKIKAQQDAGRVDIDLVLTGTDALSAGIEQRLWEPMLPNHAAKLPEARRTTISTRRQEDAGPRQGPGRRRRVHAVRPAARIHARQGEGAADHAGGAARLGKANPNRFIYARPANSGPGRTFMMGLPYILGDKDPKDPVKGWDKTWAYLKELGQYIEYYPSGTGAVMKELGEGSRDMTVDR